MKSRRLSVALLAFCCLPARAGYITPEMDRALMAGIDDIYRMRFDKAEEEARQAIALNPEHPYAYFGLAGITWTRYVYETEQSDARLKARFENQVEQAVSAAERWLKKHPKDPEGMMALGAAYGISSRMLAVRREWIRAYLAGRKAIAITREAVKADPEFYDAYLGLGLYDYYTDVYPRFVQILARLVLRGNRLRGIETLRLVAEKGHYARVTAKLLLVEICIEDDFGARDPEQAAKIMRELRAQFPDSAMLHAAELVALYTGGRYQEAASGADEFLGLVRAKKYNPADEAKGGVILGTSLWALGRREEALKVFRAAADVKAGGGPARWAVWALVRAGDLEAAMGESEAALSDYRSAAAYPDQWGIRPAVLARISRPFRGGMPGTVYPP